VGGYWCEGFEGSVYVFVGPPLLSLLELDKQKYISRGRQAEVDRQKYTSRSTKAEVPKQK
jgi:hypothetical protein